MAETEKQSSRYTDVLTRLNTLELELGDAVRGTELPTDPLLTQLVTQTLVKQFPHADIQIIVSSSRKTTTTKHTYETETPGMVGLDIEKLRDLQQQLMQKISLPGFDAKSTSGEENKRSNGGESKNRIEEPLQHKSHVDEVFADDNGTNVTSKRLTRVVTTSHSAVSGLDTQNGRGTEEVDDDDSSLVATTSMGSVKNRINIFESLKEEADHQKRKQHVAVFPARKEQSIKKDVEDDFNKEILKIQAVNEERVLIVPLQEAEPIKYAELRHDENELFLQNYESQQPHSDQESSVTRETQLEVTDNESETMSAKFIQLNKIEDELQKSFENKDCINTADIKTHLTHEFKEVQQQLQVLDAHQLEHTPEIDLETTHDLNYEPLKYIESEIRTHKNDEEHEIMEECEIGSNLKIFQDFDEHQRNNKLEHPIEMNDESGMQKGFSSVIKNSDDNESEISQNTSLIQKEEYSNIYLEKDESLHKNVQKESELEECEQNKINDFVQENLPQSEKHDIFEKQLNEKSIQNFETELLNKPIIKESSSLNKDEEIKYEKIKYDKERETRDDQKEEINEFTEDENTLQNDDIYQLKYDTHPEISEGEKQFEEKIRYNKNEKTDQKTAQESEQLYKIDKEEIFTQPISFEDENIIISYQNNDSYQKDDELMSMVESESYHDIKKTEEIKNQLSFDEQSIPKIPHVIVEEEASNKSEDEEETLSYEHPLPRYQQKRIEQQRQMSTEQNKSPRNEDNTNLSDSFDEDNKHISSNEYFAEHLTEQIIDQELKCSEKTCTPFSQAAIIQQEYNLTNPEEFICSELIARYNSKIENVVGDNIKLETVDFETNENENIDQNIHATDAAKTKPIVQDEASSNLIDEIVESKNYNDFIPLTSKDIDKKDIFSEKKLEEGHEKEDSHTSYHSDMVREITSISPSKLVLKRKDSFNEEFVDLDPPTTQMSSSSIIQTADGEIPEMQTNYDEDDKGNVPKNLDDRSSSRDSFNTLDTNAIETTVIRNENSSAISELNSPEENAKVEFHQDENYSPDNNVKNVEQTRSLSIGQHYEYIGSELNLYNNGKRSSILPEENEAKIDLLEDQPDVFEEEYDIIRHDEMKDDNGTEISNNKEQEELNENVASDESLSQIPNTEPFNEMCDHIKQISEDETNVSHFPQPLIVDSKSVEFPEIQKSMPDDQETLYTSQHKEDEYITSNQQAIQHLKNECLTLQEEYPKEEVPMDPLPTLQQTNDSMIKDEVIQTKNINNVIIQTKLNNNNNDFKDKEINTEIIQDEESIKNMCLTKDNNNEIYAIRKDSTFSSIGEDYDVITSAEIESTDTTTENAIHEKVETLVNEVFNAVEKQISTITEIYPNVPKLSHQFKSIVREETEELEYSDHENDAELELLQEANKIKQSSALFVKEEHYRPKSPIPPAILNTADMQSHTSNEIEEHYPIVKRLEDGDDVFLDSPVQTNTHTENIPELKSSPEFVVDVLYKSEELHDTLTTDATLTSLVKPLNDSNITQKDMSVQKYTEFSNETEESGSSSSLSSLKRRLKENELALVATNFNDNISSEGSLLEFERIEQEILDKKQEQIKSLGGSPNKSHLGESTKRESSNRGSITSLTEFENLEKEVIKNTSNVLATASASNIIDDAILAQVMANEDVMVLSDICEESEDAEEIKNVNIHNLNCDIEEDVDSLIETLPKELENKFHNLDTDKFQTLQDIMLSSADSLEIGLRNAHMIMETSADSLEPVYSQNQPEIITQTKNEADADADSLLDLADYAMHSNNPSSDTGHMSTDTDMTFQEYHHYPDKDMQEVEKEDSVLRSFPTTTTIFETTHTHDDGTTDTITRRVQTRITDPVHSRIRFTGTEDENDFHNVHQNRDDGRLLESVDEEGNITTIICHKT